MVREGIEKREGGRVQIGVTGKEWKTQMRTQANRAKRSWGRDNVWGMREKGMKGEWWGVGMERLGRTIGKG